MANIGQLLVEISANTAKLESELGKGQSKIAAFVKSAGSSLLSIAKYVGAGVAAAVASITYLILTTTTKIADMVDEAQALSLPVKELQEFRFAASLAGISAEGLGTSIRFMLKNVEEAGADPLGEAAKSIEALGLSAKTLSGLNTGDQFKAIGAAFNGIADSGERVKLAMSIFGRSGVQMLNLFKDGIGASSKEFNALGLAITETQASAVAKWDDARTKLGALWDGFKEQVTSTVAPALEAISNFILKTVQDMGGIGQVGRGAGELVLKGLLMAVRGMESFITGLSEGLNSIILTLETVAMAVLDVAKTFITDDDLESKIDKQLEFLNKDSAERAKPAGERAGQLFGEGFGSGLKNIGDILQKEIDKLSGKAGTGGFGSITDAFGRTSSIGDMTTAQAAAKLEADMNANRAIIARYDAISAAARSGATSTRPGQFMEQFAQGVDAWGNPSFGNADGRPSLANALSGIPTTRIALEVNLTADKDGNLVAAVEKGAIRSAVENVVLDLIVGTGKVFRAVKDSF